MDLTGISADAALLSSTAAGPMVVSGLWLFRQWRVRANQREFPRDWLVFFLDTLVCLFGCMLLMASMVMRRAPLLAGWSSMENKRDLHKIASVVLAAQVLLGLFVAHFFLKEEITGMQRAACFCIWLSSTLVAYGGPRPVEKLGTISDEQVASCDGGYRAPFQIYAAIWITGLLSGMALLWLPGKAERSILRWFFCCPKDADNENVEGQDLPLMNSRANSEDSLPQSLLTGREDKDWSDCPVHLLRRKWLPVVYGLATSAASLAFAVGAERKDETLLGLGLFLAGLAALCVWTWFWRMDLPLATWAPMSQGYAVLMNMLQEHLLFRNFKWDSEQSKLWFPVQKMPGIQIFLIGVALMVFVLWFFDVTHNGCEAWAPEKPHKQEERDRLERQRSRIKVNPASWWQVLLFVACTVCLFIGITEPLIKTKVIIPQFEWLDGDQAEQRFRNSVHPFHHHTWSHSYCELLTLHYENKMPFSAAAAAYTSVLMPVLLFTYFWMVLLRPSFLSDEVVRGLRMWIVHKAPYRFVTPMVLMLTVSLVNIQDPGSASFQATFTRGMNFYMLYCLLVNVLALSVEGTVDPTISLGLYDDMPEEAFSRTSFECKGPQNAEQNPHGVVDSYDSETEENSKVGACCWGANKASELAEYETEEADEGTLEETAATNDSDDGSRVCCEYCGIVAMVIVVGIFLLCVVTWCMYWAIKEPLITVELRYSELTFMASKPTMLELWNQLWMVSPLLGGYACLTLLVTFPVWLVCAGSRCVCNLYAGQGVCTMCLFMGRSEWAVRPFVHIHVWAFSVAIFYYSVSSRNKDLQEVCFILPQYFSIGIIIAVGTIIFGLVSSASRYFGATPTATQRPQASPPSFPAWLGAAPMLIGGAIVIWMSMNGPHSEPVPMDIKTVNRILKDDVLPAANRRITSYIPESRGDCQALWDHRRRQGNVPMEDIQQVQFGNTSSIYKGCIGHSPVSRVSNRKIEAAARWATGLNTLHLKEIALQQPNQTTPDTELWRLRISGIFKDLNIWMNVMLPAWGTTPWTDDYMCCDKNFNFTAEVSLPCQNGKGFKQVARLRFLHIDKPELKHSNCNDPDQSFCMEWVYGKADAIDPDLNRALDNFLSGKTGRLLMKTSDGDVKDLLKFISDQTAAITNANINEPCPHIS